MMSPFMVRAIGSEDQDGMLVAVVHLVVGAEIATCHLMGQAIHKNPLSSPRKGHHGDHQGGINLHYMHTPIPHLLLHTIMVRIVMVTMMGVEGIWLVIWGLLQVSNNCYPLIVLCRGADGTTF